MPIGKPHLFRRKSHGFTLLAVLAAMFFLALGTQKVMFVVSQQAQRDREAELLRIGEAFVHAIGTYYEASPGSVKQWPANLSDLTNDKRFVGLRRHLRQVYFDPISRTQDWGFVTTADGGISGVYSRSDAAPIRSGGIALMGLSLPPASRYSDWQFVYRPPLVAPPAKTKP